MAIQTFGIWQTVDFAPEGDSVLVYFPGIDAVDLAHKTAAGRWISNGGTKWPAGVISHWMPLPDRPAAECAKEGV